MPALIATVVYGVPPMLRLTTLALNQVPKPLLELGDARRTVHHPAQDRAALRQADLLVGLNQCILLSLAMVVLAALSVRAAWGPRSRAAWPAWSLGGPAGRAVHRGGGTPARPAVARP